MPARRVNRAVAVIALCAPTLALAWDTDVPDSNVTQYDFQNSDQHWNATWDSEHYDIAQATLAQLAAGAYGDANHGDHQGNNYGKCTRASSDPPDVAGRTPSSGFCVTDLNSWAIDGTDQYFNRADDGDNPDSPLQERYLPEPDHMAELPDALYSVFDYIGRASYCVPEPGVGDQFNGTLPPAPDRGCHRIKGYMGLFNSNHFGTQSVSAWRRYHHIALQLADRARRVRVALTPSVATHPEYADAIEEAEREALTFEFAAQHFLQDRWSVGHMWQRWGAPDDTIFSYNGGTPQKGFSNSFTVAAVSGLLHGSQAVFDVPAMMCSPDLIAHTQQGVQLDVLGYRLEAGNSLATPFVVTDVRPAQYGYDSSPSQGLLAAGVGDYRWKELLSSEWDLTKIRVAGRAVYVPGPGLPNPFPLPLNTHLTSMQRCLAESGAHTIAAFGADTPGLYGAKKILLPAASIVDPETDVDCFSAWATNDSMWRAANAFGLDLIASYGHVIYFLANGVAYFTDTPLTFSRTAIEALVTRLQLNAARDPNGTTSARGGLGTFLNVPPNQNFGGVASYFEPENFESDLPDYVLGNVNGNQLRDRRTFFGYFNRSHADYWCGKTSNDANATPPVRIVDTPHIADDNAVNLAFLRRPSNPTTSGVNGPVQPDAGDHAFMDKEVHACEIFTERLYSHTIMPDPTDAYLYESRGQPMCETLARAQSSGAALFPQAAQSPALADVLAPTPLVPPDAPYAMPREYAPADVATRPFDDQDRTDASGNVVHKQTGFLRTVVNWCERIPVIAVVQSGQGASAVLTATPGTVGATTPPAAHRGFTFTVDGHDFGIAGTVELVPDATLCPGCGTAPYPAVVASWSDTRVSFVAPPSAPNGVYALRVTNTSDQARPRASELYARVTVAGACSAGERCGYAIAAGHFVPDPATGMCPSSGPLDIVVGAPGAANDQGQVYLIAGNAPPNTPPVPLGATLQLVPNRFGAALAAAKLDGDSCDDLVVGSPSQRGDTRPGRAEVIWGGATFGSVRTSLGTGSPLSEPGRGADDEYGTAVAIADVDGDGWPDVLVGAPNTKDPGATTRRGRLYLFINPSGVRPAAAFSGPSLDIYCSSNPGLSCPGDVNTDWGENVVAKPLYVNPPMGTKNGAIVAAVAPPVGAVRWLPQATSTLLSNTFSGAGVLNENVAPEHLAGMAVGDFDGDGLNELFVGAHGASASSVGQVYRLRPDAALTPPSWDDAPANINCVESAQITSATQDPTCQVLIGPSSASNPDQAGNPTYSAQWDGIVASKFMGHSLAVRDSLVASADDNPMAGFLVVGDPQALAPIVDASGHYVMGGPSAGVAWVVHHNKDELNALGGLTLGLSTYYMHPLIEAIPATGQDPRGGGDQFGWFVTVYDQHDGSMPQVLVGSPGYSGNGGGAWICPDPVGNQATPIECSLLALN